MLFLVVYPPLLFSSNKLFEMRKSLDLNVINSFMNIIFTFYLKSLVWLTILCILGTLQTHSSSFFRPPPPPLQQIKVPRRSHPWRLCWRTRSPSPGRHCRRPGARRRRPGTGQTPLRWAPLSGCCASHAGTPQRSTSPSHPAAPCSRTATGESGEMWLSAAALTTLKDCEKWPIVVED